MSAYEAKMSFKDKIMANGMDCLQVKKHVTQCLSKFFRVNNHSLVDRGNNGGIDGGDRRVICKYAEKKVSTQSADNY